MDKFTKGILTVIAIGIIGLNVKVWMVVVLFQKLMRMAMFKKLQFVLRAVCVALMLVGTQCCTLKVINSDLVKVWIKIK